MRLNSSVRFAFFAFATLFAVAAQGAREIPVEYRRGMIWLKVAPNDGGAPLSFLLDSGAGASVLDLGTARRIGMKLGRSETVQGVSGRTTAFRR
ncbi:MAG: aspartyl protease family protein, partial [Chthoniobacterales bacterium]